MMTDEPPEHPHPAPAARVWVLTVAVGAASLVALAGLIDLGPLTGTPIDVQWWALAPMFFIAELTVVHFGFRQHAHTYSMSELPLVVGLFLAPPTHLIAGQFIGTLLALSLVRRQPPAKLAFNIAQFSLQAATAIFVFRRLAPASDPLGPRAALAVLAAALTAFLVASVLVNLAIRLAGGRLGASQLLEILALGTFAVALNTALALVAVNIVWLRPDAVWIAAVPPLVLFLAYRAYAAQRTEHARLSAVYDATIELHRMPQIESALTAVTARARTLFNADIAEIALFPKPADEIGYLTASGPGHRLVVMRPFHRDLLDSVLGEVVSGAKPILRSAGGGNRPTRRDVIAAPLYEKEAVIGVFSVRDPLGDVGGFGPADLKLLTTVAGQVSVSLENGRLEDSLVQLTRLKEELHHQAHHDALTGLANRSLLRERLAEVSDTGKAALLFLDLDDFKRVNDTHGHKAGDRLLRMVGERLSSAVGPDDTVARLGGDEFAVILTSIEGYAALSAASEKVLSLLETPFTVDNTTVFTRASIGVAPIGVGDDGDEILRRADQAMYTAKWQRKGTFEVFGESMDAASRRAIDLRAELQSALVEGTIELHYQPIVDLATRRPVASEALLRWRHPRFGPIDPLEVLAVAEDTGLIDLLQAWTIEQACSTAARMRRIDPEFWMAVNLSTSPIEASLLATVETALRANNLDPAALVLEITETVAVQSTNGTLDHLAYLGVRIAIDDFGTGYSSLARLDTLPIHIVKVDRSFIARMMGPGASPLAQMVLEIGDALGIDTIAEGVETPAQHDHLVDMGCRLGQGFLYGGAVTAEDLAVHLELAAAPPAD